MSTGSNDHLGSDDDNHVTVATRLLFLFLCILFSFLFTGRQWQQLTQYYLLLLTGHSYSPAIIYKQDCSRHLYSFSIT